MERYERDTGRKVTVVQLAENTGISRKVLHRITLRPSENVSTTHIDKLLEFFFVELSKVPNRTKSDRQLMESLITELVEVFPERGVFAGVVARVSDHLEIEATEVRNTTKLKVLWSAAEELKQRKR